MVRQPNSRNGPTVADRNGPIDPRLQAFGMRLRRTREAAGLSIDDLAHRAGLSPRQVIRVEHGRASPSVLWILDIADALDVDPAVLFAD